MGTAARLRSVSWGAASRASRRARPSLARCPAGRGFGGGSGGGSGAATTPLEELERAYADEAAGKELLERMRADEAFAGTIKAALADPDNAARLRAAVDASPYMDKAVAEAQSRVDPAVAVTADLLKNTGVRDQLSELQKDPERLEAATERAEEVLREVAAELVAGVKEYWDDFGDDAEVLLGAFERVAEGGVQAYVVEARDRRVANAITNALLDRAEEEEQSA